MENRSRTARKYTQLGPRPRPDYGSDAAMRTPPSIGSLILGVVVSLASLSAGCDRAPPSEGLQEWSATDHDRSEEQTRLKSGQQAAAVPKGSAGGAAPLADIAWK